MKSLLNLLLLFSIIFYVGCNNKHKIHNQNEQNNSEIITLANVNGHNITNKVLGKNSALFFKLKKEEKQHMIEKLINDELLIAYIFKKRNETIPKDENLRAKRGLTLIKAESLSKILPHIDEENLSHIYEKDKKKYWHPELIEISNILVEKEKDAKEILKALQDSDDFNTTFVQIAKTKSIDKVAKNGGYLGFIPKENMVKPIQEAVDTLKEHEYTQKPIKTVYGYHIIYLHSKKPKGYFSFKEAKRDILLKINEKNVAKWSYNKLQELRKSAKIKILIH